MSTPLASRYLIQRKLGEGGMAEVLEAVAQGEAGFTRRVAIKRLRSGHAEDPSFSRMFLDEARIASRLHHGGIVGVLDYGVVDGTPFQILEFVDGENARALVQRGQRMGAPMPLHVALYLVTEIARALHYAHTSAGEDGASHGVVHRDVKPANILVSRAGDVKLADFGIAFATERSERTQTGVAKGTPGYMAPEQIVGGAVDARTDIFSLGCTLHALVAGTSPLARAGNLEQLLAGERLGLAETIPEEVAEIIHRAIDARPSERYPTAAAMADDLGAVLAARLRSDPKGALLKWLDIVGQKTEPASLDALLMPEILLENDGASWRVETTHAERKRPPPASPPPPRPAKRRWSMGLALASMIVAGGAIAVHFARRSDAAPMPPGASAPAPLTSSSDVAAQPPPTGAVVDPTPTPAASHAATVAARPQPTHVAPTTSTVETAAQPSNVRGTLAVRGGAYRGATITIDGKVEPFGAPHYFELSAGKHTVELRLDGGVVSSGSVTLDPSHTPTQPLYFPAPQ